MSFKAQAYHFASASPVLAPLLTLIFLAVFIACTSPAGGSAGVVASVTVGDVQTRPAALARYDGNTFVAWGQQGYVAEMFVQETGLPALIHAGAAGTAVVAVRKPKFEWHGKPTDSLPPEAQDLFRQAEIDAWHLTFGPPTP